MTTADNHYYLNKAFDNEGKTYRIPTANTPRAWQNLHFSGIEEPCYYALFDNHGQGNSYFRDPQGNQSNLVNERFLYFKDLQSQKAWNIPGGPVPTAVKDYHCEFNLHDSTIASTMDDIRCSWNMFVPLNFIGEVWTVKVENKSNKTRKISVLSSYNPELKGYEVPFRYNKYVQRNAEIISGGKGMYLDNINPFKPKKLYNAYLQSSLEADAHCGLKQNLFGVWDNPATPVFAFETMEGPIIGSSWYSTLIMRHDLEIAAGESQEVIFLLGCADDKNQAEAFGTNISSEWVAAEKTKVNQYFDQLCSRFSVETGDTQLDAMMSYWTQKQVNSYLVHKKAFRDNLQVDMAYAAIDPQAAEDNLLDALSYLFEDGHAPHAFRPINTLQYSDKPAWVLLAVPEVIRETGDFSYLKKEIPFLSEDGKTQTANKSSVRDHLIRAMRFLANDVGPHGINLMHHADWNDGMDGLSRNGPGESAMVTLIFLAGLKETIAMAKATDDTELRKEATEIYEKLSKVANDLLWDGEWYIRGFDGLGNKVGSKSNKEGQIYLNSQSWALLAGIVPEERKKIMWKHIDERLESDYGMRLVDPVYSQYDENVGCMSAYMPGEGENGCYNHAAGFNIFASALSGRKEAAWRVFKTLMPGQKNNPVEQSQNEPYSFTNAVSLNPRILGLSGLPWRTGTSAWMYRNFTEGILGLQKDFAGLKVSPCLPAELKEFSAKRIFRGNTYNIRYKNSAKAPTEIFVNGEKLEGQHLPLGDNGTTWEVEVKS